MLHDVSVVLCGNDAECGVIRRWIEARERASAHFRLVDDVLDRENPIRPLKSDVLAKIKGDVLLVAPRNPRLIAAMNDGRRTTVVIDRVTLFCEAGYDYADRPTCLEQFMALVGETYTPDAGEPSSDAIAALARGGFPALTRAIWAEKFPGFDLPGSSPDSPLVTPWAVLRAADREAAAEQWRIDKDARYDPPVWMKAYGEVHGPAVDAFNNLSSLAAAPSRASFVLLDCCARRAAGDPRLVLGRVGAAPAGGAAFERLLAAAERDAYHWLWENHGIPATLGADLVLLFVEPGEDEAPWAVTVLAGGDRRDLLADIAKAETRERWGTGGHAFSGMAAAEHASLTFHGATKMQRQALETVVGHLLDALLSGNRPLVAWRTSWLQLFRSKSEADFRTLRQALISRDGHDGITVRTPKAEERAYFIEHIRATIDPTKADLAQGTHELCDECLVTVEIEGPHAFEVRHAHYDEPVVFDAPTIAVHFFHHACFALEWTSEGADPTIDGDDVSQTPGCPWWRKLFTRNERPRLTAAELLDRNRHARFVYSPFLADARREADTRAVIACLSDSENVSPLFYGFGVDVADGGNPVDIQVPQAWLGTLLKSVFRAAYDDDYEDPFKQAIDRKQLTLLEDDRAHVICSAIGVGSKSSLATARAAHDAMLYRLMNVDAYGSGFPCAAGVARQELTAGHYDRFAEWGSDYVVSDHAFGFLGFGPYARGEIHQKHMQQVYRRMFLFSQLHAAILNAFTADLRELGDGRDEWKEADTFRKFANFTGRIWCDQVTTQVQGAELFDLMRKRSSADVQYAYLRQEVKESAERTQNQINVILAILVFLGGLVLLAQDQIKTLYGALFGNITTGFQLVQLVVVALGIAMIVDLIVKRTVSRTLFGRIAGLTWITNKRTRVVVGLLIAMLVGIGVAEPTMRRVLPESLTPWLYRSEPSLSVFSVGDLGKEGIFHSEDTI